jgi:hypothetical protein
MACAGAATLTITMAVPAAAASGPADCPGIDVRDPLRSVKCPVDDVTRQVLPSGPATAVPTKSPALDRTAAPAARRSGGDRPTRPARRHTPAAATAGGRVRGGAGNGGPAIGFLPPLPATMQWPQAEPSYPYPEVAGDPAYDGVPGHDRLSIRAASAEGTQEARILWALVAAALVVGLCAMHLRVAGRLLRQEADRPLS